jgi:hypothetical protein
LLAEIGFASAAWRQHATAAYLVKQSNFVGGKCSVKQNNVGYLAPELIIR